MTNTVNPATSFIDVLKGQVETLKSERATMLAEATAICDAAQAEPRNLTPAETAQLDKLTERGKQLGEDIEVIVAASAITYITRFTGLSLGRRRPPAFVRDFLAFVPVSAFSADAAHLAPVW